MYYIIRIKRKIPKTLKLSNKRRQSNTNTKKLVNRELMNMKKVTMSGTENIKTQSVFRCTRKRTKTRNGLHRGYVMMDKRRQNKNTTQYQEIVKLVQTKYSDEATND